jgi:hypothetical protein
MAGGGCRSPRVSDRNDRGFELIGALAAPTVVVLAVEAAVLVLAVVAVVLRVRVAVELGVLAPSRRSPSSGASSRSWRRSAG